MEREMENCKATGIRNRDWQKRKRRATRQ